MSAIQRHAKAAERFIPRTESFERRTRAVGAIMADLKARADAERRRLGRALTEGETERLLNEAGTPEQLAQRYLGGPVRHPLVERYLAAVGRRLPEPGSHDILAELREGVGARIEAIEAEQGRSATDEEVGAILKSMGPPALTADGYAGRGPLIGPELGAYFWPAQRTVFGVLAVIVLLLAGVSVATGDSFAKSASQGAGRLIELGLLAFAQVTLAFILLERSGAGARISASWNPRSLPADHVRPPKTLFDSVFNLAADGVFLLVWTGVIAWPNALAGDRDHSVTLHLTEAWGPVGGPIWLAILGLGALSALVHAADVVLPAWTPARAIASVLGRIGAITLAVVLLGQGPLVEARVDAEVSARLPDIAAIANWVLQISLGVALLIWLVQAAVEAARLAGAMRWRAKGPERPLTTR
jgi:hypothetical protein